MQVNDSTTTNTTRANGSFELDVLPLAGDLYRYALSRTKNAADAEDLVQDTLLKAFKAYDGVREDTYFKAWTLTIMRHTWISNHRATERRPAEHLVGDLSDEKLALTRALNLPTMQVAGLTMLKRMALIVDNARITHVFYPVFPPDQNAGDVLAWLKDNPVSSSLA